MKKIKKPKYKRILLKISGESLKNSRNININLKKIKKIAKKIKEIIKINVQVAIVIGGGNLFRGLELKKIGINQIISDNIGMLSTIINGLILKDILNKLKVKTTMMSSIEINKICNYYNTEKTINLLEKGKVVILSAGTGNPLFTTDSAACLRGIEINADIILKGTKVNGVYSSDPFKNKEAIFYKKLSFKNVLNKKLKIMDSTAFILAKNNNIPINIFNINKKKALLKIIMGKNEGTFISN